MKNLIIIFLALCLALGLDDNDKEGSGEEDESRLFVPDIEFPNYFVTTMSGNKEGSDWLVVDSQFICI